MAFKLGRTTQERREAFDYRAAYLEHNRGVFGIYFCAQCGKPLRKEDMQVDHIIPLNKGGANMVLNCVATCAPCNRSKSDKVSVKYITCGVIAKTFEEISVLISNVFRFIFLKPLGKNIKVNPVIDGDKVSTLVVGNLLSSVYLMLASIAGIFVFLLKNIFNLIKSIGFFNVFYVVAAGTIGWMILTRFI